MNFSDAQRLDPIAIENYLEMELRSRIKHEYVGGRVYSMVGGSYSHNLIASNVLAAFHSQLKGKPCRALNSDSKVKVQSGTQTYFYYPDVSVVCGDNIKAGTYQDKPTVIVEVMSVSTRRIDEGEKLDAYLELSSLEAYILLEQTFPAATVFHRADAGFQRITYRGIEGIISLPSIDANLALASAYDEVRFADASKDTELEEDA